MMFQTASFRGNYRKNRQPAYAELTVFCFIGLKRRQTPSTGFQEFLNDRVKCNKNFIRLTSLRPLWILPKLRKRGIFKRFAVKNVFHGFLPFIKMQRKKIGAAWNEEREGPIDPFTGSKNNSAKIDSRS